MSSFLLIPGWGQGARSLAELSQVLSKVLPVESVSLSELYDLGKGQISKVSAYAHGLESYLRQRENVILVGWSTGGIASLEYASSLGSQSSSATGLVLIATTPTFTKDESWPYGTEKAEARALGIKLKRDPKRTLIDFANRIYLPAKPPARLLEKIRTQEEFGMESLLYGIDYLRDIDLRDACSQVSLKTLLVHGTLDKVMPTIASDLMGSLISHAKVQKIEGAGHCVAQTHVDEVAQVILREVGSWKSHA